VVAHVINTACSQPPEVAQVITEQPVTMDYPPLSYQMAERKDRLAIEIHNPSQEILNLVPDRSYIIDPGRQTMPLGGGTIAPQSHIAFLLPPEPPRMRTGPSFGIGVGVGTTFYNGPFSSTGVGVSSGHSITGPQLWNWKQGQVTLHLTYSGGDTNQFEHELIFVREKVQRQK
jgi:hypothetical protein